MAAQTPAIRVTDNKARLTLPRSFANSTLLMEIRSENEIVIRRAKVVPIGNPETTPETISLSDADWNIFLSALENPPAPHEALKELMKEFGPWQDSAPAPGSG